MSAPGERGTWTSEGTLAVHRDIIWKACTTDEAMTMPNFALTGASIPRLHKGQETMVYDALTPYRTVRSLEELVQRCSAKGYQLNQASPPPSEVWASIQPPHRLQFGMFRMCLADSYLRLPTYHVSPWPTAPSALPRFAPGQLAHRALTIPDTAPSAAPALD